MAVPIRSPQFQTSPHYLDNGLIIEDDQTKSWVFFFFFPSSLCSALQTEGRDSSNFILCTTEGQSDLWTSQALCPCELLTQPLRGCSLKRTAATLPSPKPVLPPCSSLMDTQGQQSYGPGKAPEHRDWPGFDFSRAEMLSLLTARVQCRHSLCWGALWLERMAPHGHPTASAPTQQNIQSPRCSWRKFGQR